MDTSGFYKEFENEWIFAPNFVYSKNYTLEREGNRESIDGWVWYDTAPQEYILWKQSINTN
jgi:hypothetical protein